CARSRDDWGFAYW
nr:immunoglobulin heavy chain junction region [Mus musculus]